VGTTCLFSWQCITENCSAGKCIGSLVGSECQQKDSQCDLGLQCKNTVVDGISKGVCSNLIASGEQCEVQDPDGVTREYKCTPGYKCGRLLSTSGASKTCL
jgi:hypothetical protein